MLWKQTPPASMTTSAPSTASRTAGDEAAPEYVPANWGWASDRTPLSIAIAANGQPSASINARRLSLSLNRETVQAGTTGSGPAAASPSAACATALALSGALAGVGAAGAGEGAPAATAER